MPKKFIPDHQAEKSFYCPLIIVQVVVLLEMSDDEEFKRAMELQRKTFEAQFGSIEDLGYEDKTKALSDDNDDDSESEDEVATLEGAYGLEEDGTDHSQEEDVGFDEDDDDDDFLHEFQSLTKEEPKVIKFTDKTRSYEQLSKSELKLLKSGKAPSLMRDKLKKEAEQKRKGPKNSQALSAKEEEDVHNDLELQRFLQESHILANFESENSGVDITLKTINGIESNSGDGPIGKARRFTLSSRLQEVSETNLVKGKKLEKMPMSMRKGMIKARKEKIAKYEQEAKDGGIILSKVKDGELRNIGGSLSIKDRIGNGGIKKKSNFRQKGLKINSIGRNTRNGLVISQAEIDRINGTGNNAKGKKKGKRGRR